MNSMIAAPASSRVLVAIRAEFGADRLARTLAGIRQPRSDVLVLDGDSSGQTLRLCGETGVQRLEIAPGAPPAQGRNAVLRAARTRGAGFAVFIDGNVSFQTDGIGEMLAALAQDPDLAIVSPSESINDPATGLRKPSFRRTWSLDRREFAHDFKDPGGQIPRLEADWCALDCAAFRLSALETIGEFDEDFQTLLVDADFGFRLRAAGFSAASLPQSMISRERGTESGFAPQQTARDKALFFKKHGGFGVAHKPSGSNDPSSWNIIDRHLYPCLRRFGLIDPARPRLFMNHPGGLPFDYLFTVWETTRLPQRWLKHAPDYQAVMVPSRWNRDVFRRDGFPRVHLVPLGVDTDVFHPWGAANRLYAETTFLWFARNQRRKGLDIMLAAWARFGVHRGARLVIMGNGVIDCMTGAPASRRSQGGFTIADYPGENISIREIIAPLTSAALADIYRGVDFVVCSSRSEGFGFVVAEAMACGAVPIFPNQGATAEFACEGALMLDGAPARADYSDMGYGYCGDWWEPDAGRLAALLDEACAMGPLQRAQSTQAALRLIRNNYTWRDSCRFLRAALSELQQPHGAPATLLKKSAAALKSLSGLKRAGGLAARGLMDSAGNRWHAGFEGAMPAKSSDAPPPAAKEGVLFIGYAEAALGFGESFRNMIDSIAPSGLPFAIHPFNVHVESRRIGPFRPEHYDLNGVYPVNVMELAANETPHVFATLGRARLARGHTILRTYWELPEAPQSWARHLRGIDEIWAPNAFVAGAFEPIFKGPVTIIPPCVAVSPDKDADRAGFGLEPGRFYFIFTFDFYSTVARKNPLAVLRAFAAAFPRGDEAVGLVLKSTGSQFGGAGVMAAIQAARSRDSRIVGINGNLPRGEMLALISLCDAYVSLHRSEGFGLGMAEAMAMGLAVIGTDFSGSADFLSAETGFPVPFALTRLKSGDYVGGAGQVWAEPDAGAAAEILALVFRDGPERQRRALAGRALVEARYSPANSGRLAVERLREILSARAGGG